MQEVALHRVLRETSPAKREVLWTSKWEHDPLSLSLLVVIKSEEERKKQVGAVYALINALWSKRDQQRVKKKKKSERKVDQAMGLYLPRPSLSLSLCVSLYMYLHRKEREEPFTEDRNRR